MRPSLLRYALLALALAPAARAQMTEDQKILPSGAVGLSRFGSAIALMETDAEVLALVGAPSDEEAGQRAGAAYAFRYDEAAGAWTQEAKLLPETVGPWSAFGRAVAIAADGQTAVIAGSRPGEHVSGPGLAYVFARVDGTWVEQARLVASDSTVGRFGCSVALSASGEVILVGSVCPIFGNVHVFRRDDATGTWVEEAMVTTHAAFVAVSASGERFIAGRPNGEGGYYGTARLFGRSGAPEDGGWVLETIVEPVDARAVALSSGGDLALAGTGDEGMVVLRREGEGWVQEEGIRAVGGSSSFGRDAVALDGDRALIGDESADVQVESQGAALLFRRQGEGAWTQEAELVASDGGLNDDFGEAVALSARFALVGAPWDAHDGYVGSIYAYDLARALPAEGEPEPGALALSAYPNPFASATTITYALAEPGPVRLAVYDVLGREVAMLVDGPLDEGSHRLQFDGSTLPAGVYIVRAAVAVSGGAPVSFVRRLSIVR